MKIRAIFSIGVVLASSILAGCQTPQESADSANDTCQYQGLRPGTLRYQRCVDVQYNANRRQAQQASDQVAAGVAVGLIGGALIGAAASEDRHDRYYHNRRYGYRRCYGCY